MNITEESLSNLTKGLFDDINNLKDYKSDMYNYTEPKEIEGDDMIDRYDSIKEEIKDEKLNKKYELLETPKNPLKDFYDEDFDDEVMERMEKEDIKDIMKMAEKESQYDYILHFNRLCEKINKLVNKWLEEFNCYNYIIRESGKYRSARTLKELDKSSKPDNDKQKVNYLKKMIKESYFTQQVMTKYIRKYNTNPKIISERDYKDIKKFYEESLIKAFKKIIKSYKY